MSRAVKVGTSTGAAGLSYSLAFTDITKIVAVQLHLSAAATTSENFTCNLNANAGAAYDTNLLTVDLATKGATDVVWIPGRRFVAGDSLDFAWTNTDTRTFGLAVYYDEGAIDYDYTPESLIINGGSVASTVVSTTFDANVVVTNATGAAAIAASTGTLTAPFKLDSITLHLSAAGTTAENFTVNLNAADGAAFDTNLLTLDLSTDSVVDLVITPEQDGVPEFYEIGDAIDIAWPNTETRTYGLRIVGESL